MGNDLKDKARCIINGFTSAWIQFCKTGSVREWNEAMYKLDEMDTEDVKVFYNSLRTGYCYLVNMASGRYSE